ncbi:MAG: transglycosylase domain-containing protein [Bacilli bacterium]
MKKSDKIISSKRKSLDIIKDVKKATKNNRKDKINKNIDDEVIYITNNNEGGLEDLNMKKKKTKTEESNNSNTNKTIKKRKKIRIWYWLLIVIVILVLLVFLAGIGFCYYIVSSAPEFNVEEMFNKEASRIFDSEGNLFATLGSEQRQKVSYEDLPQVLIDAIIATEDSRFFQHNGFDAPRFIKASISQVLGRGGGGASTLTMQLSKLAFTSTESEGFEGIVRKFTDIYMAVFKMEKYFTKEEIIEYYVNTPCMGGNIYGVGQASKYYFGKDVKDLNLVEAAQIAGMFQSPNGYNPYFNPNDANDRKNTVLYLMKRHGYITDEQYKAASSVEIKDFLIEAEASANEYQGFIDTVVEEIIEKTGNNPYDVPMDVYTTMVRSKQDIINNFYKTYKFKDSKVEVGIGAIDNETGAIIAVGAGRYKTVARSLNLATFQNVTKRAPGSTIKPILDYGPAIEYENLSTYGPFLDDKIVYADSYMRNFNTGYKGFMTMSDCLKNSINTCALQAFRMTTNEQKLEFAGNLGITFDETYLPDSYSIGTFNGVSPIQLAAAYAAFGNGGYYSEPHSFTKIVYRENDETYEVDIEKKKVMKPQTAYMITSVLVNATNYRVKVSGTQIATKTGTTSYDQDYLKKFGLTSNVIPDAWTSSYTKDYAIAIWYGYVDGLTSETVKNKYYLKNSESGTERLKIQAAVVNNFYEKNSKFTKPSGLSIVPVEMETVPAQSPSEYTPSSLIKSYMFISGTEPSETSTRFSQLNNPTNVTYSISGNNINLSWNSPGVPDSINTDYLRTYFNNAYSALSPKDEDLALKYLNNRIKYNETNIGTFGFEIYLTQGVESTYVGYTEATTYTINTLQYAGAYDGVIIKSAYSKWKNNASSGTKIVFDNTTPGNGDSTNTPNPPVETIKDSDITVKMSGLSQSLKVNDTFTELGTYAIDSIKYNNQEIKSNVTNLSVVTTSITKDGSTTSIPPTDITHNVGTYKVVYTVTFTYKTLLVNRTFTQTVVVN